jgi:hypothetical protein
LTRKLTVKAHAFSASARAKIEKLGGACPIDRIQTAAAKPKAARTRQKRSQAKNRPSKSIRCSIHPQHFKQLLQDTGAEVADFLHHDRAGNLPAGLAGAVPGTGQRPLEGKYFDSGGGQERGGNGLLGMYSMFTGGGFENAPWARLGIMPYISATIILQLLQAVIPSLSKLAREEGGRTKLIQYGRVLTLFLCLGQGW